MNDICSQLINKRDYEIPKFEKLKVTFNQKDLTFRIYSEEKILITKISNLLQNFKIDIIDSLSFKIDNIYDYKIKTDIKKLDSFLKNENIFLEIIHNALLDNIYTLCKLYYMAWEGFSLREIFLLRSLIKYLNQLFYGFNENIIISALLNNSK